MSDRVSFLSPVGRLVMGSVYKASTKDADGNPLTFKSGPNAGQARSNYFLALAIPKTQQQWQNEDWGKLILSVGVAAFPQAHKSPTFAWKVTDGDDTTPNMKGKRACDTEGFPGNWILKFSGSYAPKVYREENGAYGVVTEEGYIKPGYFVRISGTVSGNNSQQRPGIYLNHDMIAFAGYGQEIHFGRDANDVFGSAPAALPAGASSVPFASSTPLPTAPVVSPTIAAIPTHNTQVVPNPAFLNVPAPPPAPPTPPAGPRMTAKAGATSYLTYKTAGWSDEQLVSDGYMLAQ